MAWEENPRICLHMQLIAILSRTEVKDNNMATIIRQSYIDKIEKYLGKETIIVLVGQRRVGKSCMMKMIRDRKIKLSYLCNRKSCLNYYEK